MAKIKERLELAKRYLENAKETLKKAGVDVKAGRYEDMKYIVEASGTARIGKDKDLLIKLFDDVYTILYISAYYRELRDKKAIDSGFEKVEKIIRIVEKHINGQA